MIDPQQLQKLINLPIEGVAERLGLTVKRHTSLCPFHPDSNPSLHFNVRTNRYRCFVCDAHGDTVSLVMHHLRRPFVDACRWLADGANVIIETYAPKAPKQTKQYPPDVEYLAALVRAPFLNEEARAFLFDARRYNPRVVEWLGISSISRPTPCWRYGRPFYDAPSLLLPYKDTAGRVLNVQSRFLGCKGAAPRFRFPGGSSIHIFNLPILRHLKPGETLWVAEGVTDCIAMLSAGLKAIAIPSATLLKRDDLEPLKGLTLAMYPDDDTPGERLFLQLRDACPNTTRHQLPLDCKDFSDYWRKRCAENETPKTLNC